MEKIPSVRKKPLHRGRFFYLKNNFHIILKLRFFPWFKVKKYKKILAIRGEMW